MTPLTIQEAQVRDILLEERLPSREHYVFGLPEGDRISVDFLVFVGAGIVLECTRCEKRRGQAMSEVRRRGAFMDYRFGLLKKTLPRIRCGSLVEAPHEDQELVTVALRKVMSRADFFARSPEELRAKLSPKETGIIGRNKEMHQPVEQFRKVPVFFHQPSEGHD